MAEHSGQKAILSALFANLGIAVAKMVAFLATGAASMLAESIHSVADSSNQGLLLLGRRRSEKRPSEVHPFGYGRERYFWSFVVALVLFSLGGVFSLVEGYEKLRHPSELGSIWWAVGVLVVGIVLECFSFRTAIHEAKAAKGDRSWWSFIRTAKSPELPVVLLEDLGALVGLVVALAGVSLSELTHNPRFDAAGSMAIGFLLAAIGVLLSVEMKGLLIGESASPLEMETISQALGSSPNVRRLLEVRSQHLGPQELLVAAKVELAPGLSAEEVANAIDGAEARVRQKVPAAVHLYLEPDLRSDGGPGSARTVTGATGPGDDGASGWPPSPSA